MDQLSALVYKNTSIRSDVEKLVDSSKWSQEKKDRWKAMLFLLTANQLEELKAVLIRENIRIIHPDDFLQIDQNDDKKLYKSS